MRSFTFRITCRFAVLVTATTAAVLVIGGWLLSHEMEQELHLLHDIEVHELTELIGTDPATTAPTIANRIKHDADSDAALFVIQVADLNGNVLFRSDNLGDTILPGGPGPYRHETVTIPFLGRVHLSTYSVGPWRIHIGTPLEPSERVLREYARMCVPLLLGAGLVSIGLGYAFSRATLRPIRAIESTARRITADNLHQRIPVPPGRDELSSLVELLNQTFDRLETSFEQIRRFSADASHELKTPLALMRLNLEKLRNRIGSDGDAAVAIGDVLEEVSRLHQIIDRLLFLAKAESGALPVKLEPAEMADIVAEFTEDAEVLAEDRGVQFAVTRSERGEINVQPDLLRQLLLNLVANAVAVSPRGTRIELESFRNGGGWQLVLSDQGPGIPEADLPRIFERFVQVAAEDREARPRSGHGLGLAICRSIAELHHGRITAKNRTDGPGLRVTVTLP